jgi:hypothetical protein
MLTFLLQRLKPLVPGCSKMMKPTGLLVGALTFFTRRNADLFAPTTKAVGLGSFQKKRKILIIS